MDQQQPDRFTSYDAGFYLTVGLAASLFILLTAFEFTKRVPNSFMKMEKAILGHEPSFLLDPYENVSRKVEQSASFPGGQQAMKHYMVDGLKYPCSAFRSGLEGKVLVQFIIETDGSVSHVSVTKGVSNDIDLEAIRLVKNFPKWEPAMDDGRPTRQLMTLPVMFKLKSKKQWKQRKQNGLMSIAKGGYSSESA